MPLTPGDPAPVFYARSTSNPNYGFNTAAGRNLVLVFVESGRQAAGCLKKLAASPVFDDARASLFIVTRDKGDEVEGALPLRVPGVRAFFDDEGVIAKLYGVSRFPERPVSFLISPRLQVLGIVTQPVDKHADAVLQAVQRLPQVDKLPPMLSHAPVLVIPHVFEPDLCRALIDGYEAHGGRSSGFMRDVDGKTVEIQDKNHKVRRDWMVEEEQLTNVLRDRFRRRVIPEIHKAFQFQVTRMERYLVACYDAGEGGHFRAHRDNTTKGTAHRRFAASVNLNTEDYDGGNLRFPEFGMQTYRPPTGGCVIFSCSLLHEATPVTKGSRYAFLPFLYDEAARKIRDANLQYLADK